MTNIWSNNNQTVNGTTETGVKFSLTCDPDTITNIFQQSTVRKSNPSRRIASYMGTGESIVASAENKSVPKRAEFKKYLNNQTYEKCFKEAWNECTLILDAVGDQPVDLQATLKRSLSIALLEHLLGINVKNTEFVEELLTAIAITDQLEESPKKVITLNSLPLPTFIKNWFSPAMKKKNQIFDRVANKLYNYTEVKSKSWFSKIKEMEKTGKMSRQEVLGELRSIFFNADNLAISIIWTVYALSVEDSKHLKQTVEQIDYARYCYMEMLRLQPPVNIIGYVEKSKCPFHFKKQTVISIADTHRSPKNWDRPLEFDPMRFSKGAKNIPKNTYIPFGTGDRKCPAVAMSMSICPIFIQSLFKNYRFYGIDHNAVHRLDEKVHPELPPNQLMGITRSPQKNQFFVNVLKIKIVD